MEYLRCMCVCGGGGRLCGAHGVDWEGSNVAYSRFGATDGGWRGEEGGGVCKQGHSSETGVCVCVCVCADTYRDPICSRRKWKGLLEGALRIRPAACWARSDWTPTRCRNSTYLHRRREQNPQHIRDQAVCKRGVFLDMCMYEMHGVCRCMCVGASGQDATGMDASRGTGSGRTRRGQGQAGRSTRCLRWPSAS